MTSAPCLPITATNPALRGTRRGYLAALFTAGAVFFTQPAAAQNDLRLVNHWHPSEVLQTDGANVLIGSPPANAANADWAMGFSDNCRLTLKNRATGTYLARQNDMLVLVNSADASAEWTPKWLGDYVRLGGAGTKDVLDRPAPGTLDLADTPDGHWSSQWQPSGASVPDFVISELDKVSDWTTADPKRRDCQIFAAYLMYLLPDNAASLLLKKRWAKIFPYDVGAGDNNRGENVLLEGPPMDRWTAAYNAQTTALYNTGFYAAPGEEITITVPQTFVSKGALVQIGNLDEARVTNDPFVRFPFPLSISKKIETERVTIRNGFGGPIYIRNDAGFDAGGNWINVAGGTRMPVFKLGVTGVEAWRNQIRHYAAPWAEISSTSLAVTLPSALIRWLDNPDAIAWYWERVMQEEDAFVGIAQFRKAPDRTDLDIAMPPNVGAWAGDHTMTAPLSWADDYLAAPKGNWWGWYHELGHSHQAPAWGHVGKTSELTNNIVLLYARHVLHGASLNQALESLGPNNNKTSFDEVVSHFAQSPADRSKIWTEEADPNDYSKSKPFTKLALFAWLGESLGWDTFKTAFAAYHAPNFNMPANDQEQAETLMVELSKAANRDLSSYFEVWGQPIGQTAKQAVASLPAWVPSASEGIGYGIRFSLSKPYPDMDSSLFKLRDLRFQLENDATTDSPHFLGNMLWRKGGGPVKFDLEFDPSCLDCEKRSNIVVGIRGQGSGGQPVWSGKWDYPRWNASGTSFFHGWTGTLDVPAAPGTYEITVSQSEGDDGNAALQQAAAAKYEGDTIGFVVVTP